MKLEKVTGCTAFSLNVDGKEEIDMTDEERFHIMDKIHDWMLNNPDRFNYVLQALIPMFGEYECDDHPCECCGDIVQTYTWEI